MEIETMNGLTAEQKLIYIKTLATQLDKRMVLDDSDQACRQNFTALVSYIFGITANIDVEMKGD